jgi:hypothetical protein
MTLFMMAIFLFFATPFSYHVPILPHILSMDLPNLPQNPSKLL